MSSEQFDFGGQKFFAKRSLGQNFLIAPKVAQHIARLATSFHLEALLPSEMIVLEVGPGRGMLTRELLRRADRVVAIEKDDRLYSLLQKTFVNEIASRRLVLIHGDAIDLLATRGEEKGTRPSVSLAPYLAHPYSVASNIPYNLTGEFLRLFLSANSKPTSVTVLVQKEVAERIVAKNGKESLLSLSVKIYGEPHLESRVSRTLFRPVPSIDSAILHISNISNIFFDNLQKTAFCQKAVFCKDGVEKKFFGLLRLGFAHKRKFLASNLAAYYAKKTTLSVFAKMGISEKIRAEDLTLAQWGSLFQELGIRN